MAINAGGRLRFFVDLLFPLVLLGAFLFAPFRPFRFAVLALLVIRALSLLYAYLAPRLVQVTRSETLIHAQRFQRFRVTLDLHNRGPIPIHYLTVTDTYGSFVVRGGGSFMVALPPGERRQVTYEAESHYRGEFKLGPVRLRGADPMGFFRWDHQSPTPATVLVYPAVFPVEMHEKEGLANSGKNMRTHQKYFEKRLDRLEMNLEGEGDREGSRRAGRLRRFVSTPMKSGQQPYRSLVLLHERAESEDMKDSDVADEIGRIRDAHDVKYRHILHKPRILYSIMVPRGILEGGKKWNQEVGGGSR